MKKEVNVLKFNLVKFRKALTFMLVLIFLTTAIAQGVLATSGNYEPQTAPLNPAFEEYLERLEEGEVRKQTIDGNPLGAIPSPADRSHVWGAQEDDISALSLPVSYDLRTLNRVTPVRDQNPYGSCWAFATYGSLESYLMPASGQFNFSENNLMRLHGFDLGLDCGGDDLMSTAYLSRWSGPVLESEDPYSSTATHGLSAAKHVQKVEWIPQDISAIKQKIMKSGAVYTHMYWEDDPYGSNTLQSNLEPVQSSYYTSTTNAYYYPGEELINHAVALVGWDDNFSRNNFNSTPPGDGAWIVKNSWGTGFGDDGYFYLSYYDTYSGYNAVAFHNAESADNYDRVYQYDDLGLVDSLGYEIVDSAIGANIFTADNSESLVAISTYALAQDTFFIVNIYTGVSHNNPVSGSLQLTQTESVSNAGYYTIDLNEPVHLTGGERFSIVILYITPDYNYPVPLELAVEDYSSDATANPGESYVSFDGESWEDLGIAFSANVCIKAFTKDTVAPEPESLTLTASPSSPTLPGQEVTFTANTTGMTNPQFQFRYRSTGGDWNIHPNGIQSSNYISHTFPSSWSGEIRVFARSEGSKNILQDTISHSVEIPVVESVTLSVDPAEENRPYEPTTLIAESEGGHNPEYAFYYQLSDGNWKVLRGYKTDSTYTVEAPDEFDLKLGVIARSSGSTKSFEAMDEIDYRFTWE